MENREDDEYKSTEGQVDERDRRQEAQASMAKPKSKSFREAFAEARKAGDKTFMFGGKKYTTELKEDAPKKAAPAAAMAEPTKVDAPKRMTPKEKLQNLRLTPPERERASIKAEAAPEKGSPREKLQRLTRGLRVPERSSYKSGGSVKSSASKRADGIAQRGKTKCKIC